MQIQILSTRELAAREAAQKIISGEGDLLGLKNSTCEKYGVAGGLKNTEILAKIPLEKRTERIMRLLRLSKVRTISGVAPIAVMTFSRACPHGHCSYCPIGEKAASAYTGYEPASLRARQNGFDPYKQTSSRISQLREMGHAVEKCDLILMGGTFNSQPIEYQRSFVKGCLDAMNGTISASVNDALITNETAPVRAVGITFETRPDCAKQKHVDGMLELGATRVELGVQVLNDEIYRKVRRGHTVKDVIEATKACKDAGLKVCYHMMPGLLTTPEEDINNFKRLFEGPGFQPDMLKIYPCLVVRGTELYEWWRKGEYVPYDSGTAADVIAECKRFVPKYVRIMRIQRDIPSNLIEAGVKNSNLRQLVEQKMHEKNIACKCMRCREAGLKLLKGKMRGDDKNDFELMRLDYEAGNGKEIFLSYENSEFDALAAFLRLRITGGAWRDELKDAALVRELHVYGESLPIGGEKPGALQHKGTGARLLAEAERIASEEFGLGKIAVMSGCGAREYYRRFGYGRENMHMTKKLA